MVALRPAYRPHGHPFDRTRRTGCAEAASTAAAANITRVFTSPRQRARRTCALAQLIPVAEIEPDLAEWDYGDYEGLRSLDIRKGRPGWNLLRDECPRGEAPAQVSDRADRLIARLRTLDGHVALFSHGDFGRVLGARWVGLPVWQAQHFLLDTASLSVLAYDHDHMEHPAIAMWNAVSQERDVQKETVPVPRDERA